MKIPCSSFLFVEQGIFTRQGIFKRSNNLENSWFNYHTKNKIYGSENFNDYSCSYNILIQSIVCRKCD